MTTDVISIGPEETLDTAVELMAQHDIASLPVTNSATVLTLLGIINRADVICAWASAVKEILKEIPIETGVQCYENSVINRGWKMKLPEIQLRNEASAGVIQTGSEPAVTNFASRNKVSPGMIKIESKPVAGGHGPNNGKRLLWVDEVKPGLHEAAEGITGRPVYRLSWYKKLGLLSGFRHIPVNGNGKCSGRFLKLSPESITMPEDAAEKYREAARYTDETAVFMSTRLGDSRVQIVLASRSRDHWRELYRGTATWRELGISRFGISSF